MREEEEKTNKMFIESPNFLVGLICGMYFVDSIG